MHRWGMSRLVSSLSAGLLVLCASRAVQAQNLCFFCNETRGFGECVLQTADYPGELPGSAALVPDQGTTYTVVADLFSGMTFRFMPAIATGVIMADTPEVFPSPGGSRTTSGVVYNPDEDDVYWVVHDSDDDGGLPPNPRLMKTTTGLVGTGTFEDSPEIAMIDLANQLGLPRVGLLGGITYHVMRKKFWGVDVVNDIYFEFGLDGQLSTVMVGDEEQVVHFRSPYSSATDYSDSSFAFGNGITYLESADEAFFDITVGDLAAGGVTVVERVFAFADPTRAVPVNIGDPTGLYYGTESGAVGAHGFLTGILDYTDLCGVGQNAELLLDLGTLDSGPKMYFVSTDTPEPATRGVSTLSCESAGNDVMLEWTLFEDVQSLTIDRVELATNEIDTVLTLPEPGSPPGTLVAAGMYTLDERLADGSYEYRVLVTTTTGVDMPPRSCQVTVGLGSTVASANFVTSSRPDDTDPFSSTWIDSIGRLLVVDVDTGYGHTYDVDLTLRTTLEGPFTTEFAVVGVSWAPTVEGEAGELVWIARERTGPDHFLQRTTLEVTDGELEGVELISSPVKIDTPPEFSRQVLGEIAYDAARAQFWIVDRLNEVALGMNREDLSIGSFNGLRIPKPDGVDATIGGGLAVAGSTETNLVLDWTVGSADLPADLLKRISYTRSVDDDEETIETPGTEVFAIDLTASTGAGLFGGIAPVAVDDSEYEYVVSLDSTQVHKLNLTPTETGGAFIRGDANADERVNISDPSFILQYLFRGAMAPVCDDSADANDDEAIDTSDAVYLFSYLFLLGDPPPPPYPNCGFDFDMPLTCAQDVCDP